MFSKDKTDEMISRIKDEMRKALEELFPVEGDKQTLRLNEITFGSTNAIDNLEKQKELKLNNRTMAIPVRGDFTLVDNTTGETLDEGRVRIINLPILTNRFTFLVDGNEYQATNQLRLKAGAYTKVAENGEVRTQINIGNMPPLKLVIDPKTQIIDIRRGTASISLYPFLKDMGIEDSYIRQYWGSEILDSNRRERGHRTKEAIRKFAEKVLYYNEQDKQNKDIKDIRKDVLDYFNETEMNPETTEITLGKEFENVNIDMFLEASKKLINVLQGE